MDEQTAAVESGNQQETERYTAKEIRKDLLKLYASSTYQKLNAYYQRENFFNILGKSRNEDAHSNFLAWLLDSHSSHGLESYPMELFLRMLNFAKTLGCNQTARVPDDIDDYTFSNHNAIIDVVTKREQLATKATTGKQRMDLHIEVTFRDMVYPLRVVIENKINSKEHDDQTTAYRNHIRKNYPEDDSVFVYLTPLATAELESKDAQDCMCKDYIQINYQYLLDYVVQPCMSQDLPDDARMLLEHYIRCLGDPSYYTDEADGKKKGGIVMAIGSEERKLLQSFWEENRKLISAYVNTIGTEDESDEVAIAAVKRLADKRSYKFNGEFFTSMPQLAVAVVREYVKEHEDITYDDLKKVFPDEFCPGYGLVFERIDAGKAAENWEKLKNREDKVKRFKFNECIHLHKENIDIVVTNQWGKDNFQTFLAGVAKTTNYKIEIA